MLPLLPSTIFAGYSSWQSLLQLQSRDLDLDIQA